MVLGFHRDRPAGELRVAAAEGEADQARLPPRTDRLNGFTVVADSILLGHADHSFGGVDFFVPVGQVAAPALVGLIPCGVSVSLDAGQLFQSFERNQIGRSEHLLDRRAGIDRVAEVGPLPPELPGRLMSGDDRATQVAELLEDELDPVADDLLHFVDEEVDSILVLRLVTGCREHGPKKQSRDGRRVRRLDGRPQPEVDHLRFLVEIRHVDRLLDALQAGRRTCRARR